MTNEVPVDESRDEGFTPPDFEQGFPDGDAPAEEPQAPPPASPDDLPVTELTDEEREQFRSVLTIGKRSKKITLFDHAIWLRSLMCDDELRIGQAVAPYKDTDAWSRAYQTATVAAVIVSVDGDNWENTLAAEPDPDAVFRRKLDKTLKLHPLVVSLLYQEHLTIESEFADLVAKLGKLKG